MLPAAVIKKRHCHVYNQQLLANLVLYKPIITNTYARYGQQ